MRENWTLVDPQASTTRLDLFNIFKKLNENPYYLIFLHRTTRKEREREKKNGCRKVKDKITCFLLKKKRRFRYHSNRLWQRTQSGKFPSGFLICVVENLSFF